MRRSLSIVSILLLFSASCTYTDIAPSNANCVVTKRTVVASGVTYITSYEYDEDKRLTKVTESYSRVSAGTPYSYTYKYSNNEIASVEITNLRNFARQTILWTHENGQLVNVTSGPDVRTIQYDDDNRIAISRAGSPTVFNEIRASYQSDGQLQTVSYKVTSGPSTSNRYDLRYGDFDGRKNPNSLLAKSMNQPIFFEKEGNVFIEDLYTGNPLSEDLVWTNVYQGAASISSTHYQFTYDYERLSYPWRIIKRNNALVVSTMTFEYKDCN
jgi:hypothetical protein